MISASAPEDDGNEIPLIQVDIVNENILYTDFGNQCLQVIDSLNTSSAHGDDDKSICMLKVCDWSIAKTLNN